MQRLQLAIPEFIFNNEPTVVPGGGAEIIPLANQAWFANNGFSQTFSFTPTQHLSLNPPDHDYPQEYEHPHEESRSAPFGFDISPVPAPRPLPPPRAPSPRRPPVDLSIFRQNAPPPPMPLYSASGFDLLGILARVATRPNPRVVLGPVDLTCAFVVVDTRRFDYPIIYCSPSFCSLTGYSVSEVIGKNCRFLQAPFGLNVQRGERRTHTSNEAVSHLRKCLVADKECQTSIVNYKKDGTPFINLVTVIPLPGGLSDTPEEEKEYTYHVGFQVDLTDQPNAILDKLRHGSYLVNYSAAHAIFARARQAQQQQQRLLPPSGRERKANLPRAVVISEDLIRLIRDPGFMNSIPLSTSTVIPPSSSSSSTAHQGDSRSNVANHPLHLLLLESTPDFIHVVSLKGNFLYVAPSVRRVLGYEPEDMVGKSISDYAHPDDVVPLTRELKENSATGSKTTESDGSGGGDRSANSKSNTTNTPVSITTAAPRTVNLLFRARTKMGRYVWVECRGRLHVEPGKGRKAIVLSGRAREMVALSWMDVKFAGGLARQARTGSHGSGNSAITADGSSIVEQEVWGMLEGYGKETMTFLSVGKGSEDVLGWSADELIGRSVMDVILDEGTRNILGSAIATMRTCQHLPSQDHFRHRLSAGSYSTRVNTVQCVLKKKNGDPAEALFIIYCSEVDDEMGADDSNAAVRGGQLRREAGLSITPAPLVYQIRLVKADPVFPAVELAAPVMSSIEIPDHRPFPHYLSPFSFPSSDSPSSSFAGTVSPFAAISSPLSNASSTTIPNASPSLSLNLFQELGISRSSWHYELQQLKFNNDRLREELALLETANGGEETPITNLEKHGPPLTTTTITATDSFLPFSSKTLNLPNQDIAAMVPLPTTELPSERHPTNSQPSIFDRPIQHHPSPRDIFPISQAISIPEIQYRFYQEQSHQSGDLLRSDSPHLQQSSIIIDHARFVHVYK